MIKTILASLIGGIFTLTSSPALATSNLESANLTTPGTERTLLLPEAADHSPVISLGSAVDPQTGKVVNGYAIVHYRQSEARPPQAGGGSTSCYGYLAKGAKWKTVEPWVMNPANASGLDGSTLFTLEDGGINKWEDATDGLVGNSSGADVIGIGAQTTNLLQADTVSPDGANEVYFTNISDPGAIAVTIVWGIFSGPVGQRQLVEWDQVFDDTDYSWSLSGEAGKMDFDNIATHEIGHGVGMADLYNSCVDETMYGYANFGETKKRDLNTGDISGVNQLY